MPFDLGDLVPLTITIRDSDGAPADAGAVTLTIGLPDGADAVINPDNPEVGRYQVDYPTVQAGRHTVRWLATGVNASAYTDTFDVRPATPEYLISLASAKDQCKIPRDDTSQDERLREFVEAAAYVIENHRKEALIRRTVVEHQYVREPTTRLLLHVTPVISVASIGVAGGTTAWNVAALSLTPNIGLVRGATFSGNLEIVYVAGRAIIPANYTLAGRIIVQHLWETTRGNARTGVFPGGQDDTTEIFGMGYAIPNRALELLGSPPPLVA